jgi:4-amino-4-deoxychorismate lyase
MTPIVLINGAQQSKISIFNRNIQFGDGLFETCVVENKKILFWVNHFARLNRGCEQLKISKVDESVWLSDVKKALSLCSYDRCVVKLILSRGDSLRGYGFKDDIKPVRAVIVSELQKVTFNNSFSLEYCQSGYDSNPKLAGIKHCNRLEQVLARAGLKSDEGIMLDENHNVISVTQGNIYAIHDNTLITPKLDKCGVEGTRRAVILDLAKLLGIKVKVDTLSIKELGQADEVFISNSIIGIQFISQIGDIGFGKNSITKKIKDAFKKKTEDNNSWQCI